MLREAKLLKLIKDLSCEKFAELDKERIIRYKFVANTSYS